MCGSEASDRPRRGALVALAPPVAAATDPPSPAVLLRGDLTFHTPGRPASAEATHARLTPDAACDVSALRGLRVVIHDSGDLGRAIDDCGLFHTLDLPDLAETEFIELPLREPLSLEVGGGGIIGRRVSLCCRPSGEEHVVVAEGVVGFNFA